jgi:hypothetical protein
VPLGEDSLLVFGGFNEYLPQGELSQAGILKIDLEKIDKLKLRKIDDLQAQDRFYFNQYFYFGESKGS